MDKHSPKGGGMEGIVTEPKQRAEWRKLCADMHIHCYGDDQMHHCFEQARAALPLLLDEVERLIAQFAPLKSENAKLRKVLKDILNARFVGEDAYDDVCAMREIAENALSAIGQLKDME
jgi:hypothetical protein